MTETIQLHYTTKWYDTIVSDCKAIIDKAKTETGIRLLKAKWEVGDRLLLDYEKFGRVEYGNKTQLDLASSLGTKQQRISEIVSFRQKVGVDFELWLKSTDTSVLSWYQIVHDWLPKKKGQGEEIQESEFDPLRLVTPYGENIYRVSTKFQTTRKDGWYIIKDGESFPTLKRRSWFFHENGREYSLREYAKVQEFPDSFSFIGSVEQIKDQIGNAVPPPMARYVAKNFPSSNAIDLFAGAGGMSLGFQEAGHKILLMVEWDRASCYTYHHNFPLVKVLQKDITNVQVEEILSQLDEQNINLVFGGPPCQGFSISGLKFKDDPRNSLYREFLRIVDGLQPNFLVMENVLGVLGFKDQILEDIRAIGYNASFEVVKGEDLGMRQRRHRVFFYGSRDV